MRVWVVLIGIGENFRFIRKQKRDAAKNYWKDIVDVEHNNSEPKRPPCKTLQVTGGGHHLVLSPKTIS